MLSTFMLTRLLKALSIPHLLFNGLPFALPPSDEDVAAAEPKMGKRQKSELKTKRPIEIHYLKIFDGMLANHQYWWHVRHLLDPATSLLTLILLALRSMTCLSLQQ